MKNRIIILMLVALQMSTAPFANAQDISGKWKGTVAEDGHNLTYYIVVNLKEGAKIPYEVFGKTYVEGEGYIQQRATTFFTGTFDGKQLQFKETYHRGEYTSGGGWCLKQGRLEFNNKGSFYTMEGMWHGSTRSGKSCEPGKINVMKAAAHPVNEYKNKKLEACDLDWMIGEWKGVFDQHALGVYQSYPASMVIERVSGCKFQGVLKWPDWETGITTFYGDVRDGKLYFKETKKVQGSTSIVIAGYHEAELVRQYVMRGKWFVPDDYQGAAYTLEKVIIPDEETFADILEEESKGREREFLKEKEAPKEVAWVEEPVKKEEKKPEDIPEEKITLEKVDIPVSLEGRDIEATHTYEVENKKGTNKLTLSVWDSGLEDGDRISLYLNGEWVLQNHLLTTAKKHFEIELNPDYENNYLVLYALNLGERPPNTATITFFNGVKEQRVTLRSDMDKCEAINFKWRP